MQVAYYKLLNMNTFFEGTFQECCIEKNCIDVWFVFQYIARQSRLTI